METDVFAELFGSKEKARLIRFFLFNDQMTISASDLAKKNKLQITETRKALRSLLKIDFVRERTKKNKKLYTLHLEFPYISKLQHLI